MVVEKRPKLKHIPVDPGNKYLPHPPDLSELAAQAGVLKRNNELLTTLRNQRPREPLEQRKIARAERAPQTLLELAQFLRSKSFEPSSLTSSHASFSVYGGKSGRVYVEGGWVDCKIRSESDFSVEVVAADSDKCICSSYPKHLFFMEGANEKDFVAHVIDALRAHDGEHLEERAYAAGEGGLKQSTWNRIVSKGGLDLLLASNLESRVQRGFKVSQGLVCLGRRGSDSASALIREYGEKSKKTLIRSQTSLPPLPRPASILKNPGLWKTLNAFTEMGEVFFRTPILSVSSAPIPPESFLSLKREEISRCLNKVRSTYLPGVVAVLAREFKGSWNFQEKSWESYEKADLYKIVQMCCLRLSVCLGVWLGDDVLKWLDDLKIGKPIFEIVISSDLCLSKEYDLSELLIDLFNHTLKCFEDIPSLHSLLFPYLTPSGLKQKWQDMRKVVGYVEPLLRRIGGESERNAENFLSDIRQRLGSDILDGSLQLNAGEPSVDDFRKSLKDSVDRLNLVQEVIPSTPVNMGIMCVNFEQFKQEISNKIRESQKGLITILIDRVGFLMERVKNGFNEIHVIIDSPVDNIEAVVERERWLSEDLRAQRRKLTASIDEVENGIAILADWHVGITSDGVWGHPTTSALSLRELFKMRGESSRLERSIVNLSHILNERRLIFAEELELAKEKFIVMVADLGLKADLLKSFVSLDETQSAFEAISVCEQSACKASSLSKQILSREVLFSLQISDHSELNLLCKKLTPFSQIWTVASEWQSNLASWDSNVFESIDPKVCEDFIGTSLRSLAKAGRALKDEIGTEQVIKVVETLIDQLEAFKPKLVIITALRNEGLRDRHWLEISTLINAAHKVATPQAETVQQVIKNDTEIVSSEVQPVEESKIVNTVQIEEVIQPVQLSGRNSLKELVDRGIIEYTEKVCEIGSRAEKEFGLEQALLGMLLKWKNVQFNVAEPYRMTKTYILKGADEAMALLDEQIVMTQAMLFSPFKTALANEIDQWAAKLALVSETLEEWLKCQRAWMYLQPIFDADDIVKQLPAEAKRFQVCDKVWRQQMSVTHRNPFVLEICSVDGLLAKWRDCSIGMDSVLKGLEIYLESKRAGFARFYFLANEELLEILSQTKEVRRVQQFLPKVFEAMASLEFDGGVTGITSNELTAMFSVDGERVKFPSSVTTAKLPVEQWMTGLESAMRDGVRFAMAEALSKYPVTVRERWVLEHAAQCVLNGSQVFWTHQVEKAIEEGSLTDLENVLKEQLLALVCLVRGSLTSSQRTTVGALIVLDVHAKDVVAKLAVEKVSALGAFEWISQLRYYWTQAVENPTMRVRCVQTDFPYGYEYLGNSGRLVITPLTDVCYMTLMGAQSLNLGGAPAGPAGTGKTETTKDLAKALAKQCLVYNCSPQVDYLLIARLFKGVANQAWMCFDEFNLINVEVLSVIAQQLLVLFSSKAQLSSFDDCKVIQFEGSEVKLSGASSVFITMNPGYAGRSELPDNLQALFRPVAMMVPDYGLIAEILLYSFGFGDARSLARKIVATFKLASEQLSAQDHYDYGMRAVKSTVEACGILKREGGNVAEDQLVLRALRDVNVPKFLKDDLPLFENIISDLFPDVERPKADNIDLLNVLHKQAKMHNLQMTEWFESKLLQLVDTLRVRHGLMLVGPSGAGKTCNYRLLKETLTGSGKGVKVITHVLNPKAIAAGLLYGSFDPTTHEWSDGIAAKEIRSAVKGESSDEHWVVFDGPVSADWIEAMNSVLDDNKRLCLVSGEIVALTPKIRLIFEVEDLAVASPATVSRCGMVYMEPSALGLDPLLTSWLSTKGEWVGIKSWVVEIAYPCIQFVRQSGRETVTSSDGNLLISLFKLLDTYDKSTSFDLFVFCIVWSIGATTSNRSGFDNLLKDCLQDFRDLLHSSFSFEQDIFGVCWDKEWVGWMKNKAEFEISRQATYESIFVPTQDTTQVNYLTSRLLPSCRSVLIFGSSGVGKSLLTEKWLSTADSEKFVACTFNCSAQTSAGSLQDAVEERLEKRRRGVFGPPVGKSLVLFIDDLNLPQKEVFGAQPPLELLRQWHDHKGWYGRKDLAFQEIVDMVTISSMGLPGGGRTFIPERLKRHYHLVLMPDASTETVQTIFGTITGVFLGNDDRTKELVRASISVFSAVCRDLLPTPSRSHYLFNLRDVWRVFQGVCSAKKIPSDQLVACWKHEHERVYGDRLVDESDIAKFGNLLSEHSAGLDGGTSSQDRLLFTHFFSTDRSYIAVTGGLSALKMALEKALDDYNAASARPLPLVLFTDACLHVSRIARLLFSPGGNALLLGVGGSGRQSLARLAAHIAEADCCQIEVAKGYGVSEFKEDIKSCLLKCGLEDKAQVFLLADTQIVSERFVEIVNGVLSAGDLPGLYPVEDMERILMNCRPLCITEGLSPTKSNIFACYLRKVRKNLHMVLAFSPVGEVFRTRIRMFPSLVNCCGIDWFHPWPAEALLSVASQQMAVQPGQTEFVSASIMPGSLRTFRIMHESVESSAKQFLLEQGRHTYVTPASYLELISTFKRLLTSKRAEVGLLISRFQGGLDKLNEAAVQVARMEKELTEMQPLLAATSAQVSAMMVVIAEDKEKAAATKEVVAVKEKEASEQAAESQAIKDDAQRDLDEALPALEVAVQCLKKLKLSHLQEVKAFANPPAGVRLTLEAMSVMFDVKPVMKNDPNAPGKKMADFWEAAQKNLLNDPKKLLDSLFEFDKDNISEGVITRIAPYIEREDFDPGNIKKASLACEAMCMWSRAMFKYHHVAKAVAPKRERLKAAEAALAETMSKLAVARKELETVEFKLAKLEADYLGAVAKQAQLQKDIADCAVKLERAAKLIGGLGGEKDRWASTVLTLRTRLDKLPGDCLFAAGMVVYSGPFVGGYRQSLSSTWQDAIKTEGLPHSEDLSLVKVLGDPVKSQFWRSNCGLPADTISIENAIIIESGRRWPLMIDPQRQANKFIRALGREGGNALDVVKLTDINFLRTLELAIQFGRWVLIENIGSSLDPALDPILLQQKTKQPSGGYIIRVGDKNLPYNPGFRLFMTTTFSNPHFSPEISAKVTLLNFAIVLEGLQDQMLGILVAKENPELEDKKSALVKEGARMEKQLQDIEDEILSLLSTASGNILDDEKLINTLAGSKETAEEINLKVAESKVTEKEIDVARKAYEPVAFRSAVLFFAIVELSALDAMYQFSLQWYQNLFSICIDNAPASSELEQRLKNLCDFVTESVYVNGCRALFERHKLLFSFSLVLKISGSHGQVNPAELRYLLTGPTGQQQARTEPPHWVSATIWNEVLCLDELPAFEGLASDISNFQELFESEDDALLPVQWQGRLSNFQSICIMRALRPDKVINSISIFVESELGKRFVEPPTFDIKRSFADSSNTTPLVFILSAGADPVGEVLAFAEEIGMKLEAISLGQGQGPKASRLISQGTSKGCWVLLQNCHLAVSWLPELERICESLNPNEVHADYRLWLTSMPSPAFPPLLLQNSVKITNEPPQGIRASLLRTYSSIDDKTLSGSCESQRTSFQRLLFGISFFHAVALERRRFGPIGWNIPYSFTNDDLAVCRKQLVFFINQGTEIPFKVLQFLGASINYGGRVTDDKDRRLIKAVFSNFVNPDIVSLGSSYKFSQSGQFFCPDADTQGSFVDYIKSLPNALIPEVFGLHPNAAISVALAETSSLLEGVLSMGGTKGHKGASEGSFLESLVNSLMSETPTPFNIEELERRFPTEYAESMNTVLKQECMRYNRLLRVMSQSLPELLKAQRGEGVLSEELDKMAQAINSNMVPSSWAAKGFLSLKPLASWMTELNHRVNFLRKWTDEGFPSVFWLSGLFFPQAFLTGTLQNYARATHTAIDRLSFSFTVRSDVDKQSESRPDTGVFVHGLYLEGCRWDTQACTLDESKPKELFCELPVIHFQPTVDRVDPDGTYLCPVYKVLSRRGTLLTTGHSTNFVLNLDLASTKSQDHWIKAGVAAFLALRN